MSSQQITQVFATIRAKLEGAMIELPRVVGNEIVNYALDAFKAQAWEGQPWDKRKSKKEANRNLLVKSGRGRRSIRIIRTTANSVTVGSDVPYMRLHNEGGKINRAARSETFVRNRYVKGNKAGKFKRGTSEGRGMSFKSYTINMPSRPFLKRSRGLELRARQVIFNHLQRAIKNI